MRGLLPLLADAVPPNIWHNLGATTIAVTPSVLILGAAALYLVGVRSFNRANPEGRWSARRTISFLGATAITFVAIELFIGVYDDVLFYDHMIQHLMLIMIAAPLYAMGAPLELLARATTGRTHDVALKVLGSKVAEVIGHPVTGFVLYGMLIPVAHLTSLYNFTLSHELAHDNEHLAFLVAGYLFWRPVVAIEPSRHPLHPGVRLLYLALAIPVDTFCGLALVSAAHEMFPYYATFTRTWGPSRLSDLHIGGGIMWIGGDGIMALAMIPCLVRWVHYEEQRTVELDARLDSERREAEARAATDASG
jgi:cytochrome c oxidase assembly factor CtaG